MAASPVIYEPQKTLEDPLAHIPCSSVVKYRKGQVIYDQTEPASHIYLVINGRVKVSRLTDCGRWVIMDIYRADEFFGEAAFLGLPRRNEQAVAFENTSLMAWSTAKIEDMVVQRPRLAVALLQLMAQRTIESSRRIESFSVDTIARRLARALIRFSERLGERQQDGSVRLGPLTHGLLAQCVGTSREIVTQAMNAFRIQGYMGYSRKGISLYPEALKEWLAHPNN